VTPNKPQKPFKKILLIYHSGSGGTKILSQEFSDRLSSDYSVDLIDAHTFPDKSALNQSSLLLFGFPVFYLLPTPTINEFISKLPVFAKAKPAFVFITKSSYSQNAIRAFAQQLKLKNIVLCGYAEFRAPGTDVSLLLSRRLSQWLFNKKTRYVFGYEKNVQDKIARAVSCINTILAGPPIPKLPAIKWYTPLTALIQKLFFDDFKNRRFDLRALPDRCRTCHQCINICQNSCWVIVNNLPQHQPDKCDLCLGCLHLCPHKAIIYSEQMKDNPRLDRQFHTWARKIYFSK
jgi:ferredoxin